MRSQYLSKDSPLAPIAATALILLLWAMLGATALTYWQRPVSASDLPVRRASIRIDVNTASEAGLCLLPGIGPQLARRIIGYRTVYGLFETLEQLQMVSGIGPRTIVRIKPLARCGAR